MPKNNLFHSLINEALINHMPGFFGIFNLESKFQMVNKIGALWTGFDSPEKMYELSYGDVKCEVAKDADIFLHHDEILKQRGHIRYLGYYCYANNDWKIILGEKYLVKNKQNETIGFVSHFNDFTHNYLIDVGRFLVNSISRFSHRRDQQFIYLLEDTHTVPLSSRQAECLFFLIRGKTIKQIARTLKLSPRTVEEHIDQIKLKFNCNTKLELIEKAISEGYINFLPKNLLEVLTHLTI